MINLLISFLVFCVVAGVFLYILKLVVAWLGSFLPLPAQLILGIAYVIVALYGFLQYAVPFLRMLAASAGLK